MSVATDTVTTIVARRIDAQADVLGFAVPPCQVQIKFLPLRSGRWTLVGLTPPAKPAAVARWLEAYSPTSIHIAPGLSPKVLHANFDKVPAAWDEFLSAVVVHSLQLTPEGSASLFVEDTPAKVERFLSRLQSEDKDARVRKTLSGPKRVRLTPRQLELMSLAVALGYYEIPHQLTLRNLADKVGLSVGAASELLRRGEALIIADYVDTMVDARWQSSLQDAADKEEDQAAEPDQTEAGQRPEPE